MLCAWELAEHSGSFWSVLSSHLSEREAPGKVEAITSEDMRKMLSLEVLCRRREVNSFTLQCGAEGEGWNTCLRSYSVVLLDNMIITQVWWNMSSSTAGLFFLTGLMWFVWIMGERRQGTWTNATAFSCSLPLANVLEEALSPLSHRRRRWLLLSFHSSP